MTQNTSSAVMQQRREPSDSFDYFPTPLWATRALLMMLNKHKLVDSYSTALDPCCGEGHMVRALRERFDHVGAYDIQDMGFGGQGDYLFPNDYENTDWTIANPPFKIALEFILKALECSTQGVAMFVRSAFDESQSRYHELFSKRAPTFTFIFSERVILSKGLVRDPDVKYWNEKKQKWQFPSTATAYCWMVWDNRRTNQPARKDWIPPCRKSLTKDGDYV